MSDPTQTIQTHDVAEVLIIDNLETMKVIADPLRIRIIELLMDPNTVKNIAAELDIPATKLYYHFKQLEEHGLIRVVDTRIVSGIVEKHYQVTARSYRIKRGLISPNTPESDESVDILLGGLFDDTRHDVIDSMKAGIIKPSEGPDDSEHVTPEGMYLNRGYLWLTDEEHSEFMEALMALLKDFGHRHEDNPDDDARRKIFSVLVTLFPSSRKISLNTIKEDKRKKHTK